MSHESRFDTPAAAGDAYRRHREAFDRDGFVIFPGVLPPATLAAVRTALAPHLAEGPFGRNEFEGRATNRVYGLMAKGDVFDQLATHPLALAFAEGDLGKSCLLSAFLAINLLPGETVQPWHHDDAHIELPRPRHGCGVSIFWAIDPMTEENGATELLPRSHLWGDGAPAGAIGPEDMLRDRARVGDCGAHQDAVKAVMAAGSMMAMKGDLWHRGGANTSAASRLILTPQYAAGWARPLETMLLAVPPALASRLSPRARELIGYSIHPPFMGYVDGRHPGKSLPAQPQPDR